MWSLKAAQIYGRPQGKPKNTCSKIPFYLIAKSLDYDF